MTGRPSAGRFDEETAGTVAAALCQAAARGGNYKTRTINPETAVLILAVWGRPPARGGASRPRAQRRDRGGAR